MKPLAPKTAVIVSAAAGIVTGVLSARYFLVGSWWNLPFWAAVAVVVGALEGGRRKLPAGAVFGFFLGWAFMLAAFGGTREKLPGYLILSLIVSLVAALCGWLWSLLGRWLVSRKKVS